MAKVWGGVLRKLVQHLYGIVSFLSIKQPFRKHKREVLLFVQNLSNKLRTANDLVQSG